jgi:hypothetical protein
LWTSGPRAVVGSRIYIYFSFFKIINAVIGSEYIAWNNTANSE